MSDIVLESLLAALKGNEENTELLLHIANHIKNKGNPSEALSYFQRVLALAPTHQAALEGAVACATETGDHAIAESFSLILKTVHSSEPAPNAASGTEPQEDSPKRVRGAKLTVVGGSEHNADNIVDVEDSNVYLSDVGGMVEVKRMLNLSFLAPLKNPEIMEAYGKSVSGGLLLYGPPGCGKTFIARALAGELGAKFISVGMHDILDMYVGESERKLHEIFESARRNTPAVLFFDELDALGQKRSQLRNSGTRNLVNQLLSEMDSINSDNNNLFILGATNHPWDIDAALKRPGRFDRTVTVFPPDLPGREAILTNYLAKKPTGNVNIKQIAQATNLYSGADLVYLIDNAIEYAIEKSLETGEIAPIETQDILSAQSQVKPSTLSWFETARNFAMFANEGGAYDDLNQFIRENKL